jgi:hypothetical protein
MRVDGDRPQSSDKIEAEAVDRARVVLHLPSASRFQVPAFGEHHSQGSQAIEHLAQREL